MTCGEVERMLAEDGALTADARAHLETCDACRASARRWEAVRRELRAMRDEAPPPFLHARVMAHVRSEVGHGAPWWRRVPRAAWASAALVGLVLGVLSTHGLWQVMRGGAGVPRVSEQVLNEASRLDGGGERPVAGAGAKAEKTQAEPEESAAMHDGRAASAGRAKKREAAVASPTVSGPPPEFVADAAKEREERVFAPPAARRDLDQLATESPERERAPAAALSSRQPGAAVREGVRVGGERSGALEEKALHSAVAPAAAPAKGVTAGSAEDRLAVEVVAEDGGAITRAMIPARAAPPPGEVWRVTVNDVGAVFALDHHGRERLDTADALRALRPAVALAPGRYLLRRAPP